MKQSPFIEINAICAHKYIEVSTYNPFLTNRFFSYCIDTIYMANEANQFSFSLDKQSQFDYYYGLISKKKRFPTWYKKKENKKINIISKYYNISSREVELLLSAVSDDLYIIMENEND